MRIKNHSHSLLSFARKAEDRAWSPAAVITITVAIYFISQILGGIVVTIYPSLRGWDTVRIESWLKASVIAQFFLILVIELLVITLVGFMLSLRKKNLLSIGVQRPRWIDAVYMLIGFGVYFVIYIAIFFIVQKLFPQVNVEQKQQIGFESARKGKDLVWVFFSLVLFPPVAEEILFRGFLYTGLRKKWPEYKVSVIAVVLVAFSLFLYVLTKVQIPTILALDLGAIVAVITNKKYPRVTAAAITSAIFAMAHLQIGSGAPLLWVAAIDTFVLSLVLVYMRERRGSLAAPMMLHMLKNGLAFMLLFVIATR